METSKSYTTTEIALKTHRSKKLKILAFICSAAFVNVVARGKYAQSLRNEKSQ